MKNFKKWNKKLKVAFGIRIFSILLTIAILLVVIIARGQIGLIVAGGSFIASIVILSLLLVLEIWRVMKFLERIDSYFDRVQKSQEVLKDPKALTDIRTLRDIVENLDIETMDTINAIKNKEKVTKVRANLVLAKTEDALKAVLQFASVYPGIKANGIKETKLLIMIYNKRIEALKEII